MIVCHCRGVSDHEIRGAVREGAVGCTSVAHRCGAAGDCGGCTGLVEQIIQQELERSATPDPASTLAALALATR
jgi:bacterioferritin-associated ferredoxin